MVSSAIERLALEACRLPCIHQDPDIQLSRNFDARDQRGILELLVGNLYQDRQQSSLTNCKAVRTLLTNLISHACHIPFGIVSKPLNIK